MSLPWYLRDATAGTPHAATDALHDIQSLPNCSYWHARWHRSRQQRASNVIEFVHVRKAAGHFIELWLKGAFYGNGTLTQEWDRHGLMCSETTDCLHNFYGGHHTYYKRLRPNGTRTQQFVAVVREPLSRLMSFYNDFVGFLSVPHICRGMKTPEYCGPHFERACRAGTGWNTAALHGWNSTSPRGACVPTESFTNFTRHAGVNEQSHFLLHEYRSSWSDAERREHFRKQLREYYLVLGLATPESTAALAQRLRYALDTPFVPDVASVGERVRNPGGSTPAISVDRLPAAERRQVLRRNADDVLLHQIAAEIEREQRLCFEQLKLAEREPVTFATPVGVVNLGNPPNGWCRSGAPCQFGLPLAGAVAGHHHGPDVGQSM